MCKNISVYYIFKHINIYKYKFPLPVCIENCFLPIPVDRLTVPLPIDVVYTWVNGSDPALTRELQLVKVSLEEKNNMTR